MWGRREMRVGYIGLLERVLGAILDGDLTPT